MLTILPEPRAHVPPDLPAAERPQQVVLHQPANVGRSPLEEIPGGVPGAAPCVIHRDIHAAAPRDRLPQDARHLVGLRVVQLQPQ